MEFYVSDLMCLCLPAGAKSVLTLTAQRMLDLCLQRIAEVSGSIVSVVEPSSIVSVVELGFSQHHAYNIDSIL